MVPYCGGVQRVTTVLSKELVRRGHEVCFLCYYKDPSEIAEISGVIFPQFFLQVSSVDAISSSEILQFVAEHKIRCIISQEQDAISAKILSIVSSNVYIISVHHTAPFAISSASRRNIWQTFPSNTFRLFCYKLIALSCPKFYIKHAIAEEGAHIRESLKNSDVFVFISERFFPRVFSHIPDFPKDKILAINNPNTFDSSYSFDYAEKSNVVLWVGRIDTNKNCMGFIKAWKVFSLHHPDWYSIIAGDGPDLCRCRRYVKNNSITRLLFTGYCRDVEDLYRKAKVYVSTSYSESWGMSLAEAISMGCVPCVYNTYETLQDLLKDGVTGLLCDPNPDSLVKKLEFLVENESLMKEMAVRGRAFISQFNVESICNRWETLLNRFDNE